MFGAFPFGGGYFGQGPGVAQYVPVVPPISVHATEFAAGGPSISGVSAGGPSITGFTAGGPSISDVEAI